MMVSKSEEVKERYEMISRLGKGSEGYVYLCKDMNTDELVAMKKLEVDSNEEIEKLSKNIEKMLTYNHPHIVKHYEHFVKSNVFRNEKFLHLCIIMELCNAGNLKQVVSKYDTNEKYVTRWVTEIADGLSYLHSLNIIHRDLKLENVLLRSNVNMMTENNFEMTKEKLAESIIKISDFGIIRELGTKLAVTKAGTALYMAPEVQISYGYDTSADIWSFGIIVLELTHSIGLKKREISNDALLDIQSLLFKDYTTNMKTRFMLYKQYTQKLKDSKLCTLMFECLHFSPEQRPTANEILKFLDGKCKDKFIRSNPEKLNENDFESPTIPLVTDTKVLHTFTNMEAKKFWKKYIGENILEVVWRSFSGAYQTFVGRLGVTRARGLKKLLCGEGDVVTVYQFGEAVDVSGFPFPQNILEKIEKYTDVSESVNIKSFKLEQQEIDVVREKFLTMILQYDNECRDIVYNTVIDIEKECVPPLVLSVTENDLIVDSPPLDELLDDTNTSPRTPDPMDKGMNGLEYVLTLKSKRCIILGDTSSGKSVFARMLVLKYAKLAQQNTDLPVPIYVNVSLLTENFDDEYPFELQCIRAGSYYKYTSDIEKLLLHLYAEKKVLLVIDGLDESNSKNSRLWLEEKILEVDKHLQETNGGIILTTRINPEKNFPNFSIVKVLPLTLSQKIEISKLRGIDSQEFIDSIKDKYEAMTSTPLYLSMFIELFKTHGKCPDNRSQLYSKAIDDMIEMHVRKLRRHSGQGNSLLNTDHYIADILEMLTQIAIAMHSRRNIYFSESDIDKTFLMRYPLWNEVKTYINEGQLSFFVPYKKRYRFSHLSFQEYLTSTKWNDKIKEEINGKLVKRNSIATLFSLGFTTESKTPFLDFVCNEFISDPWFRDTFCFLSTQLSSTDFTLFCTHFLNQKRSLSSITVIFDMLRERNSREKEIQVYKSIYMMINFKKEKGKVNTIATGMIHPNKYIRTLAEEMSIDFQIDSDFMSKFLSGFIKSESGDAESIGIALKNVLKKSPLIQVKTISELIFLLNKSQSKETILYLCKILEHLPLENKTEEETKLHTTITESLLHIMDNINDKKTLLQAAAVLINFIDKKENHRDIAEYVLKRIFFKSSHEILEISHKKYRVQRDKLLEDFKKVIEGDEEAYILKALNKIRSDEYSLSSMVLIAVSDKENVKIIKSLLDLLQGGQNNRNSMVMALEALHGFNPPVELRHEISEKLIEIFGNTPWFVRDKVCDCIIKFCKRGDPEVLKSIGLLLNSDIKFRAKLIRMLGKISEKDDKEVIEMVTPYLDDEKFDVRSEAISALASICTKLDKTLFEKFAKMCEMDENSSVICALATAWPEFIQRGDKKVLELLYHQMEHIDPLVKINVCSSLSKCANLGDETTISVLFKVLGNSSEHINVRAVAANSVTDLCLRSTDLRQIVINNLISLFKSDKHNISYHGYDLFYGSKWSLQHLGATSDNDIIFTQIYRLLRSGEGKSLTKEQIDALTKVNCLESNFILLLMNKEKKL